MKFHFIEPEIQKFKIKEQQPASYLRKSFQVKKDFLSVRIYMTALGVYKGYFNGKELDRQLLLPGFTNYHKRLQYQEYDVTEHATEGENVVGAILGDGWYRGSLGPFNKRNLFGEKTKFACTIIIQYATGEETIYTDKNWKATQSGAISYNDIKIAEWVDMRNELTGWNAPGYRDDGWHGCLKAIYEGNVIPQEGEKLLEQERFTPKVLRTPDGSTVLDFGQNLAGHVEFTVTGRAGTQVSLLMGEALDEKGNFTIKNMGMPGDRPGFYVLGQVLHYTLKEGTQTYKSMFLVSGYQYVKLENWPEEVRPENFVSIAVYSDLAFKGKFECSNPLVNKLLQNVIWSEKSNMVDIPTDCPQRERLGWTGDMSIFMETANYLSDTRRFLGKWMNDFISSQEEDGGLPVIIPRVPMVGGGMNCAGWSDAIANIPMEQYRFYGDLELVTRAYEAAKRYVEFTRRRAKKKHPFNMLKPSAYHQYVVDTGFNYGEWLEPGDSNLLGSLKAKYCPDAEVATAWFFHTTKQLAEMAKLLGREEDTLEYTALAKKIKASYRIEFIKDGKIDASRQCKYIRPIYMGLVEADEVAEAAKRLNQMCIENDYKIGTGFLTTYQILPVLTECGYSETAYKMLENEKCPGWLYEVAKGATTIWENWFGISEEGVPSASLNHFAPGAVAAWLFAYCAGIRPAKPGFSEIEIRPVPGGTFTYARAEYDSIVGTIISDWRIEKSGGEKIFHLHTEVPNGIPTRVIMPDGSEYETTTGGEYECALNAGEALQMH